MAHLHFLTFGDGSPGYRQAVRRLMQQARDARLFKSRKGYTLAELKAEHPEFWRKHGAFISAHPRGLGYWLWKPFLISRALSDIPEGDFLIFADAGCEIYRPATADLIDLLPVGAGEDLTAYRIQGHPIRQWTNSFTLKRIDGALAYADLPQVAAGLLCIRNNDRTRALVDRWFELSSKDDGALIIDRRGEIESSDFIEHRHDQSILSLLVYLSSLAPAPTLHVRFLDYFSTVGPAATSPIRVRRNRTGVSALTPQRPGLQTMNTQLQRISNGLRRRFVSLIGEVNDGALDYYLGRIKRDRWGGAFNGQDNRRAIFDAIIERQAPALIVETGTYRGTTTEALAKSGVPVLTIEGRRRNYGFARVRLRHLPNVNVHLGDSRERLRALFQEMNGKPKPGKLFAYLDAHWEEDLPLRDELDIVFNWDPDAIVMIDDFRVPNDVGYGYDDYGQGTVLDAAYIEPTIQRHGLVSLYPKLPSSEETGARRGCAIVTSNRWKAELLSTGLLREIESDVLANSR